MLTTLEIPMPSSYRFSWVLSCRIHQDTLSTEALSDHIDHTYPPSLPYVPSISLVYREPELLPWRLRVSKSVDTNGIVALSSVASDRPFLLVKLTGYRLVSTTVFIAFASGKMVPSLNGSMLASVWLEWGLAGFGGCVFTSNLKSSVRFNKYSPGCYC